MELAAQIAENIQKVLREEADALARQTGFVKRLRKLSGSSFAQVLITVFTETPYPATRTWPKMLPCSV
jgi:restriction endonuclease Mrr